MIDKIFDTLESWIWGEDSSSKMRRKLDEASTLIAILRGKLTLQEEEKKKIEEKAINSGAVLQIYKDKTGSWRWRLRAGNKKILAESGEGYKKISSLENSLRLVKTVIPVIKLENK